MHVYYGDDTVYIYLHLHCNGIKFRMTIIWHDLTDVEHEKFHFHCERKYKIIMLQKTHTHKHMMMLFV